MAALRTCCSHELLFQGDTYGLDAFTPPPAVAAPPRFAAPSPHTLVPAAVPPTGLAEFAPAPVLLVASLSREDDSCLLV